MLLCKTGSLAFRESTDLRLKYFEIFSMSTGFGSLKIWFFILEIKAGSGGGHSNSNGNSKSRLFLYLNINLASLRFWSFLAKL